MNISPPSLCPPSKPALLSTISFVDLTKVWSLQREQCLSRSRTSRMVKVMHGHQMFVVRLMQCSLLLSGGTPALTSGAHTEIRLKLYEPLLQACENLWPKLDLVNQVTYTITLSHTLQLEGLTLVRYVDVLDILKEVFYTHQIYIYVIKFNVAFEKGCVFLTLKHANIFCYTKYTK